MSVAFNDLIPGELDNFLAWMVSTGEGDTLKTIDDVKRRFTYWWQGTGLRAYNQRHNGGTRKETFGGYTSHAGGPTGKKRGSSKKQVFNLVKKHARTIQNVSRYDLSDDTEYISHARMIKALGCNLPRDREAAIRDRQGE